MITVGKGYFEGCRFSGCSVPRTLDIRSFRPLKIMLDKLDKFVYNELTKRQK